MNKKIKYTLVLITGIILLNILSQSFYKRFDLTKDKRYTLSNTSEKIISKITENLFITIYLEGDFPPEFKRLQIESSQFLEELTALNSNIIVNFESPDNQREELIKKGMVPSQLTVQEVGGKLSEAIIFPWASINYKNKSKIVFLLPNAVQPSGEEQIKKAIENLEYNFINAINSIIIKKEQKIALLSGNGELDDIYLYSFLSEVSKKYKLAKFTLDSVAKNPQNTLKDITEFDLVIIAKPSEKFTEKEKFTLDQFITNNGKTLWMIDNVIADQDSLLATGKMLAYPRELNLTDLLFSYGIRINTSLIKDLYAAKIPVATGMIGNQTQFKNLDWFFHPLAGGNPNHPITKNISPVRFQFTNQIDTLKNKIKKTPLLISSVLTQKLGIPNFIELQSIADKPKESDYNSGNQLLAVLLEGDFKSAYKNRSQPFKTSLYKEYSNNNKMIVIADGDVGKNQILKKEPYDLSRDKWTNEQFGNKDFLLNTIDYLLDDTGLIQLRNKSLQINILDKQKAFKEKFFWQFLNVTLPIVLLLIFGLLFKIVRKKKYSTQN